MSNFPQPNPHTYPPSHPPQLSPEFAAYVEDTLHRELGKVHESNAKLREEWLAHQAQREKAIAAEAARREEGLKAETARREEALKAATARREEALKAEIERLRTQLQATNIGSSRSNVRDGDDIVMQPETAATSSAIQLRSRSSAKGQGQSKRPNVPGPDEPSSKRRRGGPKDSMAISTTPKRRTSPKKRKPASHVNRVLSSELPADLGGLKQAIYTHIRILWRLEKGMVPKTPPSNVLEEFAVRFPSETGLMAATTAGPPLINTSLVDVAKSLRFGSRSQAAPHVLMVEEHVLQYMQAYLSRYGLTCWCPDLRDTPYSLYNSACRVIALATFKQAVVSGTYAFLAPNTTYISNTLLLLRIYDHFVHHYQFQRFNRDQKRPGSVISSEELTTRYKNRKRLSQARTKFAKEQKLPKRYVDIVSEVKATSDDEWDPSIGAYIIKRKPERSEAANKFFREFDRLWKDTTKLQRAWTQRERVVPAVPQDSLLPRLPTNMPLDYFDPTFYNHLLPGLRRKITNERIAFPSDASMIFQAPDFRVEHLSSKELLERFGAEVVARYSIPGEDVEEAASDNSDQENWMEEEEHDDDDEMVGDADYEEESVVEQRRSFARMVNDKI